MTMYYVIEHVPTKELMPEVHSGYTHWKPGRPESRTSDTPRLFSSYKKAKAALASYLLGEVLWERATARALFYSYEEDKRIRGPARSAKDFDIKVVNFLPITIPE